MNLEKDLKDDDEVKEDKQSLQPNWKNSPTVEKLKADLTNANTYHSNQVTKINKWLDNLNVTGSVKLKGVKGKSAVQPKIIKRQAEWRYAALSEPFLATPDLFDVNPVSWEDRKAANQNGLILNNQFQTKINRIKFIDEYVRAAVDEGTAIVRVGWEFKEKEITEEVDEFKYIPVPPEAEEIVQQLQQAMQMKQQEPDSFTQQDPVIVESVRVSEEQGQLIVAQPTGRKRKIKKKVPVVNKPTIKLCDFRTVIIDPTCEGDIERANFIIYASTSSYAELKETGLYKNLDDLKEQPISALELPDGALENISKNDFKFSDKPRQKVNVYEYWGYWDVNGTGELTPIVATWVGSTLIRLEENPYPDGKLPFVVVPYLPIKNDIYGEPDGSLIEDQQNIVGALTRGIIDLLGKSANSQTAIPKGFLDAVNEKKFFQGQDYKYNPGNHNPQVDVFMHKYPEIPVSVLNMIQMMNTEAEALTGVKAYSTGGGITGANLGDTAAGVRGALDAASKREMGILRRLSNGIIQIGRKIIAMNSIFLDEEEVVRVTNEQFIAIRRGDLAGNFDLKLTISTAEADSAKSQKLSFMLQTMGNNLDPGMTKILLSEIARLEQMPDLAKELENYQPQPDPIAEEMRQLELEYKKAEIALMQSQAQENNAKAQLQGAKIPVEQARAQSLQGDADNKALDFMQKDTGLSHERDMQKEVLKGENNLKQTSLAKNIDSDGKVLQKLMDKTLPDMSQEPNIFNQGMSNDPTTSAPSRQ